MLRNLLFAFTAMYTVAAYSDSAPNMDFAKYHWYVGGLAGFGTTTWGALVPNKNLEEYNSLTQSTPTSVSEGGAIYGGLVGYEFNPYFAVEAAYMRYPTAIVRFGSEFAFIRDQHSIAEFSTRAETVNVLAKVMVFVPGTNGVRFYSGIGGAGIHRKDILVEGWKLTPAFALGFNYNFTEHIMAELAGTFTTGYGEPRLIATSGYYPFLYSGQAKLAYRF